MYGMLKRENGHNLLDKLVAKLKQCVKIFVDMKDEWNTSSDYKSCIKFVRCEELLTTGQLLSYRRKWCK